MPEWGYSEGRGMRTAEADHHFDRAKAFAKQASAGASASDGAGGHHLTLTAIQEAEAALQLSPSDPEILLFLSRQHWDTFQKEPALLRLEEALAAVPTKGPSDLTVRIRTWQSFMLYSKRDLEGAARALKDALELSPDDQEALALRSFYSAAGETADPRTVSNADGKGIAVSKRTQLIKIVLISAIGATITGGVCFLGNYDTDDLRHGRGWSPVFTVVSVTFWILFGYLYFREVLRRQTSGVDIQAQDPQRRDQADNKK